MARRSCASTGSRSTQRTARRSTTRRRTCRRSASARSCAGSGSAGSSGPTAQSVSSMNSAIDAVNPCSALRPAIGPISPAAKKPASIPRTVDHRTPSNQALGYSNHMLAHMVWQGPCRDPPIELRRADAESHGGGPRNAIPRLLAKGALPSMLDMTRDRVDECPSGAAGSLGRCGGEGQCPSQWRAQGNCA